MEKEILNIKNLSVSYNSSKGIKAIDHIHLKVNRGDSIGIIGESGSGKSTLALSIMGLLKGKAEVEGSILYQDTELYYETCIVDCR
ncbi:MAG: ATP-binding cassette domain-containing protein [Peptostreptococcales bacterium]|jgi:peptide/nickel transport system ATP-binding protein